jgi:hypothetical protein
MTSPLARQKLRVRGLTRFPQPPGLPYSTRFATEAEAIAGSSSSTIISPLTALDAIEASPVPVDRRDVAGWSSMYAVTGGRVDSDWGYTEIPPAPPGGVPQHFNLLMGAGVKRPGSVNVESLSRTTMFTPLGLTNAIDIDRMEGFGQGVFRWVQRGHRNSAFGSLNGQWAGCDLRTDPAGRFYFHDLLWNAGTPPSNPAWNPFGIATVDPGIRTDIVSWQATFAWPTTTADFEYNAMFARDAGVELIKGSENAFFAYRAGALLMEGDRNAYFGSRAGFGTIFGSFNCYFGAYAGLVLTTGSENLMSGYSAGRGIRRGSANVIMGSNAGFQVVNINAERNVWIGHDAGREIGADTNDTFIVNNLLGRTPILSGNFATGRVGVNMAHTALTDAFEVRNPGGTSLLRFNNGGRVGSPFTGDRGLGTLNIENELLIDGRSVEAAGGRPSTVKILWSGDWQPVDAPQIAILRAVLDNLAIDHPDLARVEHVGDLVNAGTDAGGAAPLYGHRELIQDLDRLPIPRDRFYAIGGNHDRDATGIGAHAGAWSYNSYRRWFGREFYYDLVGNHLTIHMGDMAGTVTGEVLDYAVEWFGRVVRGHPDCNILLKLHQPLSGTYFGLTEVSDPGAVQLGSSRIIDIINSVDNIYAVLFGHVHNSLASVLRSETHFGCRHINVAMGIPESVGVGFDRIVTIAEYVNGSQTVTARRWSTVTRSYLSAVNDIALTMKYPASTAFRPAFDGRFSDDPRFTVLEGVPTTVTDAADYRINTGTWVVPAEPLLIGRKILQDRANDAIQIGTGMREVWALPGAATDGNQYALPSYGDAAEFCLTRLDAAQTDYSARYAMRLRSGASFVEAFAVVPSGKPGAGAYANEARLPEQRHVEYELDGNAVGWSHTGSTAETTVLTLTNVVPANALGPKGQLKITILTGAGANNANSKAVNVKINGTTVCTQTLVSTVGGHYEFVLRNRNSQTVQVSQGATQASAYATSAVALGNHAFDTTQPLTISFTITNASAGDTTTLHAYSIKALYGR